MFTSNDERIVELRNVLEVIREEIGAAAIDEVAFAWITSHPAKMIPITGSYDLEYVKRQVEALKYHLTAEQWYMIWTAVKGHKYHKQKKRRIHNGIKTKESARSIDHSLLKPELTNEEVLQGLELAKELDVASVLSTLKMSNLLKKI